MPARLDFLGDDLETGGFQFAHDLVLMPGIDADLIIDIIQIGTTAGAQPGSREVSLCLEKDHV